MVHAQVPETTPPAPPVVPTTPVAADQASKFRMGMTVSPVLSWFSPDADADVVSGNGVRFSANYGLNMAFRLGVNPNYFFSTGLYLIHTGGTLNHQFATILPGDNTLTISERESFFRLNYVNIPITFLMRTNEIGYMKYFAKVGFDAGVNVKANADVTDKVGETILADEKADMSDYVNLVRTALHLELGFEYNLTGTTDIAISLEWNNGLNNVFNDDYRLPTVNSTGGVALDGGRIKSITNALLLNATLYF